MVITDQAFFFRKIVLRMQREPHKKILLAN